MLILGYLLIIAIANFSGIEAHGRLMDPVNRGSAFRKGFDTPENWDDDGNYCGGYVAHHNENDGKCGVCGDNYADPQPRANENGGTYGKGVIVKKYKSGSEFDAVVEITANHFGFFTFDLCQMKNSSAVETEKCFDEHRLELASGDRRFPVETPRTGDYVVRLRLPKNLKCEHCVLRWQYTAGNNWGYCDEEGRTGALGCGPQEMFRTCSDITIE